MDRNQAIGFREGQRTKHHAAEDGEYGGVEPDPDGEDQHRGDRKGRGPLKGSRGDAKVRERPGPPFAPAPLPALLPVNGPALLGKARGGSETRFRFSARL